MLQARYNQSVAAPKALTRLESLMCPQCGGAIYMGQGDITDLSQQERRLGAPFIVCVECPFASEVRGDGTLPDAGGLEMADLQSEDDCGDDALDTGLIQATVRFAKGRSES